MLKRMFGHHYKYNDLIMEKITRLMGHKSTRTTETPYCNLKLRFVVLQ